MSALGRPGGAHSDLLFAKSGNKRNLHAPVPFAFAPNLEDADGADLGDVPDVRAATGLQVDPGNLE